MNILVVHNHYQQRGGEDEVAVSEVALLRSRGHHVEQYNEHNDTIPGMSRLRVAARTLWSRETYLHVRALIRETGVDVVHVHNFFPLVSPAVYYAARAEGAAVVQTLHNYRLLCPNALFFRAGAVCEDCLGKSIPIDAVRHGCYRDSRAGSAVVTGMIATHHALRTWTRMVDAYIALTEFGRQKFIQGGLPADRIMVKPNFVDPDPGIRDGAREYALFVGRLAPEKGIFTLLDAWRHYPGLPLRIVGDGPLYGAAQAFIQQHQLADSIHLLGRLSPEEVMNVLQGARFLVFPSEWYETFGRVAIEAFACGVPVIASDLGAIREVVQHGVTGLLFRPGAPDDLAKKACLLAGAATHALELGRQARLEFESRFSAEANYSALTRIYDTALFGTARARATAKS